MQVAPPFTIGVQTARFLVDRWGVQVLAYDVDPASNAIRIDLGIGGPARRLMRIERNHEVVRRNRAKCALVDARVQAVREFVREYRGVEVADSC